jgi:chemotaxis family two-component system response regulator Rcp1
VTSLLTDQRTILVVEDNAADAALVFDALERTPSSPALLLARDGHQALARLRDPATVPYPDLLLLDLNLPGFSGLQTLAELKADTRLRHIPVLMLTTSKSQDEINRCYALGAAAVLNKPLRLRDHRAMIEALASFWLGPVRFAEGP